VFLLVPDTVEVVGEHHAGDDMLDNAGTRATELAERLQGIAIDVLARRTLKNDPAAYRLSESALSDQTFSRDTKEREQALRNRSDPPSPARRWVSLRSTHPTQKQRVVGWVEERNPSIRGESDGGV
jgi:hypothetical protein